ncbi:glyoxalase [Gluconobacter sp. DsW_056]|uniref:VOC family protein n=1 Tax=Gluconobacter sp. DsW_056 TaxID=1511209 RepID=UPI000A3AF35C|nr:VOC family protein [Gluconobacter sp. DsW_056]OUI80932.1 glyoxalase [Gluconobacter sp. DsW_056]
MFSHIMLGSNDIVRSKAFYDATLGVLGCTAAEPDAKGRLVYAHSGGRLIITKPLNGEPATGANGGTVGFAMSSPEQADAWHKAGVENGGEAIENPPGIRHTGMGDLYLAYLRDPDGNKLCALHRVG